MPSTLKSYWIVILTISFAFYFYGLGVLPLLGPDEPRYAQVAREMYERKDLVTPTLHGHTWFEKPALLYWVAFVSYHVFGISEFSARLGSACAGILTALLVGWLGWFVGRRIQNPETTNTGLLSYVAVASSLGLIAFSRAASFDIYITATITLALTCFLASELESQSRKKQILLAGFYIGIGLSLLAKGLIGIVLPCGIIGLYHLLHRQRPNMKSFGLMWGIPLALAVAAVWYGPMLAHHGWHFVDEFFIQHHFARYVSDKYRHPQPFYFYIPVILLLQLPWTLFLITSILNLKNWFHHVNDPANKFRLFAFSWMIFPIAFFSISGSKLPGYILPALPGAALLVGDQLSKYIHTGNRWGQVTMRITGIIILLLGITGLVYFVPVNKDILSRVVLTFVPLIAAGIIGLFLSYFRKLSVVAIGLAMFLSSALMIGEFLNRVVRKESIKGLLQSAANRGYSSTPITFLYSHSRTAEFYAEDRLFYDSNGEPIVTNDPQKIAEAAQKNGGTVLVVVPYSVISALTRNNSFNTEVIDNNGRSAIAAVHIKPLPSN